MCSTRMSDDPGTGVVDADCKVFGGPPRVRQRHPALDQELHDRLERLSAHAPFGWGW